ncbi:MAG: formimidoylglutamate deiminase [Litoreibacter sp.]|nr:formimidoylglutamate deiminase [Litoreibacter sp.]
MEYIRAKQALTENGWQQDIQIGIASNGRIGYLGPVTADEGHRVDIALPAPANVHSHAFQRAMAGLTEARGPDPKDSFWTWRRLMYRFLDQLNPDQIEAIATLVFMEMMEAGYAAVAEFHYLHHAVAGSPYANLAELSDRVVAAAETAGIGLTLLPVLYQYGGCDRRALAGGQLRFSNDPDRFARLHEGATATIRKSSGDYRIGVAPHSLRAVDEPGLNAAIALCPDGPVHMHLAEQVAEVEEVEAHLKARPTEWLLDHHVVDQRWCLIHCTQMTAEETVALARSGAVAGLCPITESNLGDGIFNGTDYLGAAGKIGFGSDSNIHISLFDELRTLEYSQRLRDRSRAALATGSHSTGRVLIAQGAVGGAQAAGRASGVLAEGMLADILGLETDNQWLCNRQGDAALDTAVFGGHGQDCITDVWSAGRHIVKEGRHSSRERIVRDYKKVITELGSDI